MAIGSDAEDRATRRLGNASPHLAVLLAVWSASVGLADQVGLQTVCLTNSVQGFHRYDEKWMGREQTFRQILVLAQKPIDKYQAQLEASADTWVFGFTTEMAMVLVVWDAKSGTLSSNFGDKFRTDRGRVFLVEKSGRIIQVEESLADVQEALSAPPDKVRPNTGAALGKADQLIRGLVWRHTVIRQFCEDAARAPVVYPPITLDEARQRLEQKRQAVLRKETTGGTNIIQIQEGERKSYRTEGMP
jgi:hypothetical protein